MVTGKAALAPTERQRVAAAIAATEQRTGAHFAVVVVPMSDRYALFPVAWAAILALSATGILALLRPDFGIGDGFLFDAALFIALGLVLQWPPLRLLIVPGASKRRHARQLAHREFALEMIGHAPPRHGVLFFVSLGERYVEVLADREIHRRVAPGTWEKLVADFIAAVRADRLADGVVAAIETCGATLGVQSSAAGGPAPAASRDVAGGENR